MDPNPVNQRLFDWPLEEPQRLTCNDDSMKMKNHKKGEINNYSHNSQMPKTSRTTRRERNYICLREVFIVTLIVVYVVPLVALCQAIEKQEKLFAPSELQTSDANEINSRGRPSRG